MNKDELRELRLSAEEAAKTPEEFQHAYVEYHGTPCDILMSGDEVLDLLNYIDLLEKQCKCEHKNGTKTYEENGPDLIKVWTCNDCGMETERHGG